MKIKNSHDMLRHLATCSNFLIMCDPTRLKDSNALKGPTTGSSPEIFNDFRLRHCNCCTAAPRG